MQRPSVVLRVRQLDPTGFQCHRQSHQLSRMIDVGTMHHHIDRERQTERHHLGGQRELPRVRVARAGDMIRGLCSGVLDGKLKMIKAGLRNAARRCRSSPMPEVITLV